MSRIALLIASLNLATVCTADDAVIGFGDPKVIKVDWSMRSLRVADLDGDGLQDMAVINNDSSQIDLLYQAGADDDTKEVRRSIDRDRWTPVLEDAPFDSEKVSVGFPMFDLGVGDLDGNGLPDLAYTAREIPLTIRYQGADGEWSESVEFDGFEALGWNSTLQVVDLDGDDRLEIVLLSADAVRVFYREESGRIGEPAVYFLTGENPFNLETVDITGDGLAEICYVTTEGKQSFVMREQLLPGSFGAERRSLLEQPLRMYALMNDAKQKAPGFATVNSRSGAVELFVFKKASGSEEVSPLLGGQPRVYPVFKKSKGGAQYAFGDLNGDGETDLQVANPEGAELMVFMQKDGRFLPSKRFPTLSDVSSLSSGRFFDEKNHWVIALSKAEETIGLSRLDSSGRISFPRLIDVGSGEPVVCQAVDLDGDGFDELALVNELDGEMQLVIARPVERDKHTSEWEILFQADLEGVRRQPNRIRVLNTFGGRGPGLMLFVPREAPVLLAHLNDADRDYDLAFIGEGSSVRESFLKEIRPSQVSEVDVDGDGSAELVAARSGFARAIRLNNGELEMVDQFNSRRETDLISAIIPILEGDLLSGLVFYVAKEGELQFLIRDDDGVLRYRKSEKVGSIDLDGWVAQVGRKGELLSVLFYGSDRFWAFSRNTDQWVWKAEETYETDLEDVFFSQVQVGDFNGDGFEDLIAVDGNENVVEILRRRKEALESRMYWQIFDQNMHYQGRTGAQLEPRQTVTADFNGDGRLDLAFLVHDRILYYLQE